jgi:hypothetical protein
MQSDEATPTPTPAGRTPARRRSSRRARTSRNKRLAAALAVTVTVVGLLTQVTSLIDWIGDRFGDEPAATVAPEILGVEPRSPSTLRDYKNRVHESIEGLSKEQLDQIGRVFTLTMSIQGEQGEPVQPEVVPRQRRDRRPRARPQLQPDAGDLQATQSESAARVPRVDPDAAPRRLPRDVRADERRRRAGGRRRDRVVHGQAAARLRLSAW